MSLGTGLPKTLRDELRHQAKTSVSSRTKPPTWQRLVGESVIDLSVLGDYYDRGMYATARKAA